MGKKFEIHYLPAAEQDLLEIIEYILLDNPDAAIPISNNFDEAISTLELFPLSGSIPNDIRLQTFNYRILIVGNYHVFYEAFTDFVEIRRILQGKRKYDFLI